MSNLETLPQEKRLSAAQLRVLSLVDNGRSATHDTSDPNAFVGRMRTIRSLRDRGMMDGYDLTDKGRNALYYYRERSTPPGERGCVICGKSDCRGHQP